MEKKKTLKIFSDSAQGVFPWKFTGMFFGRLFQIPSTHIDPLKNRLLVGGAFLPYMAIVQT